MNFGDGPIIVQRQGQQVEAKPAFTVIPKTKKITVNKAKFVKDDKSRRLVVTQGEEEVSGYELQFYRGHSIFVLSLEELTRLGYTGPTPLLVATGNEGEAEVAMVVGSQVKDKAA